MIYHISDTINDYRIDIDKPRRASALADFLESEGFGVKSLQIQYSLGQAYLIMSIYSAIHSNMEYNRYSKEQLEPFIQKFIENESSMV